MEKVPYIGRHGKHVDSMIKDRLQSVRNLERAQWDSVIRLRDKGQLAYKPTLYGKILTLLYTFFVFFVGALVGLSFTLLWDF